MGFRWTAAGSRTRTRRRFRRTTGATARSSGWPSWCFFCSVSFCGPFHRRADALNIRCEKQSTEAAFARFERPPAGRDAVADQVAAGDRGGRHPLLLLHAWPAQVSSGGVAFAVRADPGGAACG